VLGDPHYINDSVRICGLLQKLRLEPNSVSGKTFLSFILI